MQFNQENVSSVFLINQDELTLFCKNLIEYIKNSLKIDTYDFENYSIYNLNNILNPEYLLSEQFLTYLLNLSNIKDIPDGRTKGESKNRTKVRRCLEVIVFALLNSTDYNDLKSKLIKYTALTDRQVIENIKNFIPLLSSFNPNFNISDWLPKSKLPITYNEILNLIAPYGHTIKTSEKELYEKVKKDETWVSRTFFELLCHDCNKSFFTCYHDFKTNVNFSNRCPHCAGNIPITFRDILDLAKSRNWTVLSTEKEFLENKEKYGTLPSKTKFLIQCENGFIFPYTYNYLKMHSDCQYCTGNAPITYNDLKQIIEERIGTIITTFEEFELAKKKYSTLPSETKVIIKCSSNHIFNSTWGQMTYNNNWCPYCASGRNENTIRWYLNKIFNYIVSLYSQTPSIFFSKCSLKDLNILDRSSLYEGRMQYDGYSQINLTYNFNLKIPFNQFQNKQYYKKIYNILENFKNFQNFLDTFNSDYENFFSNNDKLLIYMPFGEIELIVEGENLKLLQSSLFLSNYEISNLNVLKIAFEYSGYQHYLYPNIYHDTLAKFLSQIINDLYKKKLSFENNIILLEFPYFINLKLNDPKKIQDYLIKKLGEFTNINFNPYKIPQFNHLSKDAFRDILSYS